MKYYLPLLAVIFLVNFAAAQDVSAVDESVAAKAELSAASVMPTAPVEPAGTLAVESVAPLVASIPEEKAFPEKGLQSWRPAKPRPHETGDSGDGIPTTARQDSHFQWSTAIKQSLLFLGVQHGYALTQPKTRRALAGPFISDYFSSVKGLHGWGDGGRFFTNYIAHPMQGSLTGFIQVQNDPRGRELHFGNTKPYIVSRLKATAWAAAWSTQFEIGPLSQASIGNVGLYGKQTWVDLIVTPTIGSAMMVSEDALDRFVVRKLERKFPKNFWVKIFARMLLNPTRTVANTIAFKDPWHRSTPR
jgi:hypothetical protein